MKTRPIPRLRGAALVAALTGLLAAGCTRHLAFTTATQFGLDISQTPGQPPKVAVGYHRAEVASIPVAREDGDIADADAHHDAYSVLGTFVVDYNPGLGDPKAGLHIHQVFATGVAAQAAARNRRQQESFGTEAGRVDGLKDSAPPQPR